MEEEIRCLELSALRHGETLFVERSTRGSVRADIVSRDVLTGQNASGVERVGGTDNRGELKPLR